MRADDLVVSAAVATGVATDADIRTFEQEAGMASPTASGGKHTFEVATPSARLTPAQNFEPPSGYEAEEDPEETNCLTNSPLRYFFASRWWFLFFICAFCCLQSLQVTGLFSSTLSSIQARYHVSSSLAGGFWALYDSVVAVSVLGFALAGGRSHIPRYLGTAAVLVGVGSIIYSSPQYFSGKYEFRNDRTPYCTTSSFTQTCHDGTTNLVPLFFIGQSITALGAACLYTLGPAYLDRIFSRKDYSIALGCFYFVTAVGPAIGFLIASRFLNMWVDLGSPPDPNLQPSDREWVGAWWLAYLVSGLLVIAFSVPLFLYPKYVIGSKPTRDENKRHAHAIERQLLKLEAERFGNSDELRSRSKSEYMERTKTWQQTFKSVLTNKTFMFNVLGQAANSFTIAGVSSFLPKVAQSLFGLTAGDASLSIGLVVIPGAAGGSLIGGFILKKLKAKPLTAAKMLIIVEAIAIVFCTFLLFGCNTPQIIGIQKPYPDSTGSYLNATCNQNCICNEDKYNPICGSDGQNYFSACHAGCTGMSSNGKNFWNCTCMGDTLHTGVKNVCKPDCNAQSPFLALLFLAMFFTFLSTVPAITVIIRALPFQDRPTGLAFQNVVSRSLGAVPGPPITGLALDSACFLFATSCGSKLGDCVEYDNYDIRRVLAIVILIPKCLTVVFYSISYYFFRDVYPDGEDLLEEPVSDQAAILSSGGVSSSSFKDAQL